MSPWRGKAAPIERDPSSVILFFNITLLFALLFFSYYICLCLPTGTKPIGRVSLRSQVHPAALQGGS